MKIVVVASLAYSLVNFRGRLLRAMIAAGHEVIACAPDEDPAVIDELAAWGIAFRRVPMARVGLNPLTDLATLAALVGLIRAERPDVVLAYTQKPIVYAGLACRLAKRARFFAMVTGLGHVYGDGGGAARALLRRGVSRLYRAALRKAEAVFVFNGDDRGELLRHRIIDRATPVVQVPGSGVDVARYAPSPLPEGAPVFLMVCRLLTAKGIGDFAAAARLVQHERPAVRCRLLGPREPGKGGIDPAELDRWIAEGSIAYLGETRDVRPFLAEASVFVLPSWYREGLPRTILEAMAAGRPVITTDRPGCREPIEDGRNGFVVPARDPAALAAAMRRFADDPGLAARMGAAARRTAVERFAVERVNALLLDTMSLSRAQPVAAVPPAGSMAMEAVA